MRCATRALLATMACAALAALSACGGAAVNDGDDGGGGKGPIKVALVTDSSGAVASFGQSNIQGAKLAVEDINKAGGVLGRKVQLLTRDSQAKPELGVTLARDAVLKDKVAAIFGPVSSGVAVAMTDVAKRYRTPIFFHTSNSDSLVTTNFHKYAFMVTPNTSMEGRANGIQLAKAPYKRWAVIAPDYEFGHLQSEAFIKQLKQLNPGVKIVKQVFPALGETDFTSYITSVLATKPDAVYGAVFGGDLVAFTKQAESLGFFKKTYFTSLYDTEDLRALKGRAPMGVRGYARAPFWALKGGRAKAFVDEFKARYGAYPSDWAIMAYDAVKLWAQGVATAKSTNADKLVGALQGATFDSLRGQVTIRARDHQASVPLFSGKVEPNAEVGFPTWKDVQETPGTAVW